MKAMEVIAGLIMTAVVLYYVFNPNSPSVINSLSSGTTGFVNALLGKG